MSKKETKLSHEEFVRTAVMKLRSENRKGIHCVYSGLNGAIQKYFGVEKAKPVLDKLVAEKKINIRPTKGGVMVYLPEDMPNGTTADDTLAKMGL